MTLFKRFLQGVCAFWRAVNDDPQSLAQVHRVERVEPLIDELDDPFGPLSQQESHIVVAPLFDGDVEFASSKKRVEQCGSELNVSSEVRSVYRAEDGVPLTDVEQMFQCPSCRSVVSQESLFVCQRCKLRFCRGPGCRNEVEQDSVRLDVCQVCLKQYYKPLFVSSFARKLFDY